LYDLIQTATIKLGGSVMKRLLYLTPVFFFSALCILPGIASADIMMRQKHHTDSYQIMGNKLPAKDSIETIWITNDGFRSEGDDNIMIFRVDKNTAYIIGKKDKTYMEQSLNVSKVMNDALNDKGMSAEDKKAMNSMMKNMMDFKLTISETNESKKINVWNCKKYVMKLDSVMGPSLTDIWATQDIKIDQALFSKYKALSMSITSQAGLKESFEKAQKEYSKIKGITVLSSTSTNVMGSQIRSTVELLEYNEGKAPAGALDIPAGYKKVSPPNMMKK
jgi:hypothetical protein